MFLKTLLALSCLSLAASSSAQIYKSVGADGKVSYTNVVPEKARGDRKPAVPAVQSTLGRSRAQDSDADPGGRILTPDVISAVSNVIGVAQLVSSSKEFCIAAQPAFQQRYASAAEGWGKRNAAVVAQKDRILSHPVQQMIAEALNADMVRKTASLMQPVRQSGAADRIRWCDSAFTDVDRGALDLVGRASIAPLMNIGRR